MPNELANAMTKVVEVLSPLSSEERLRVVNASLALLGDGGTSAAAAGFTLGGAGANALTQHQPGISPQASAWMAKHNVTVSDLENWYHFDGGSVTPLVPANASKRSQQAINTYLLLGFSKFLASGDAAFSDQDARQLCEHFGCYDHTNHAKIYKAFGNKITGSKSGGWKLTAPGINAAGALIKGSGSA